MIIAGAGGHALEVFDVLLEMGVDKNTLFFFEETKRGKLKHGLPIISSIDEIHNARQIDNRFCLGVGNPDLREKFYLMFTKLGLIHFPIISPRAFRSEYANNEGADLMPFTFLSSHASVGVGALINTGAKIHHEAIVGNFAEISPQALILGKAQIGEKAMIGANASVLPEIQVGKGAKVGAGAVVTINVGSKKTVKGVPAR